MLRLHQSGPERGDKGGERVRNDVELLTGTRMRAAPSPSQRCPGRQLLEEVPLLLLVIINNKWAAMHVSLNKVHYWTKIPRAGIPSLILISGNIVKTSVLVPCLPSLSSQ